MQGRRAVEGSCAHGTEAGGHRGSGLEAGAAADGLDPCPRSLAVLTHKSCRGCHTPVTKEGSSPCPTPGPAIPPACRNPGGPGSDCPCPRPSGVPADKGQEQVSSRKGSALPRELPEREKVFPLLAGVREVEGGGGLAGATGGQDPYGQPGGLGESGALTSWGCLLPSLICDPSSRALEQRQVMSGGPFQGLAERPRRRRNTLAWNTSPVCGRRAGHPGHRLSPGSATLPGPPWCPV